MKSLVKWIVYVPVAVLSVLLMFFSSLVPETITKLFALDANGVAEIITFSILGLFLVCFVVSIFEKKVASVYLLKKNYFAAGTALLAAFAMAASAALKFTTSLQTGTLGTMGILTILFTVLGGVSMLFVGLNHFSGINTPRSLSILYLTLPLWCGVYLISRFMEHTASPVAASDSLDLVMFVAFAMYFIYAMMIHAVIPVKGAVKNTISFGFPASVIAIVFAISEFFKVTVNSPADYVNYLPAVSYLMLGLYALSFSAELSRYALTTDQVKVIGDDADADDEEIIEDSEDDDNYDDEVTAPEILVKSEEKPFVPSAATAVRVAEDDEDDDDEDAAAQLFFAAKQQDVVDDSDSDELIDGSEDDMIIEGENEVLVSSSADVRADDEPKGPVVREAIMFDEDFILSMDNADDYMRPKFDKSEDISAFILDSDNFEVDDQKAAQKNYNSRLDEIDRLIISIQGGDSKTEEID